MEWNGKGLDGYGMGRSGPAIQAHVPVEKGQDFPLLRSIQSRSIRVMRLCSSVVVLAVSQSVGLRKTTATGGATQLGSRFLPVSFAAVAS